MLLLSGCSHFKFGTDDPVPECTQPPKVASKLDNLLTSANDMTQMPTAARTVLCHNLVKRQQESPSQEVLLQLVVGRTISDACGDISKLLDQTNDLPATALDEEALRRFVGLQQEVLKNMLSVSKKLSNLEKKKKKKPSNPDSKDSTESISDETRLLREKLDAIRSMEKQLDGSSEAK
jgi:hypothetical protein